MAKANASSSCPAGWSWQKSLCLQCESLSLEDWRQVTLHGSLGLFMHHESTIKNIKSTFLLTWLLILNTDMLAVMTTLFFWLLLFRKQPPEWAKTVKQINWEDKFAPQQGVLDNIHRSAFFFFFFESAWMFSQSACQRWAQQGHDNSSGWFRKKSHDARGMPIEYFHRFDAVAQNNLEAL